MEQSTTNASKILGMYLIIHPKERYTNLPGERLLDHPHRSDEIYVQFS